MKSTSFLVLVAAALAIANPGWAKPNEPAPIGVAKYKGEDLPVFETRQVMPLSAENPRYPDEQAAQHTEGQATIVVVIDVEGKVIEADIKESKPVPAFGVAAQAAVRKWRWPKVTHHGQPTKYIVQQVVAFDIH